MAREERDELARRLRETLVKARKAAGITQVALAKALGRPQSYVSNYERGERRIEAVDFVLIAKVLGTDARELLGRME